MDPILQRANDLKPRLIPIMETLHRHPEVSFHEYETTRYLKEKFVKLELEIIDLGMDTGFAALLRGGQPGKLIAIRADIDAIALQESPDNPVRSEIAGIMHACGHDFHATCALGAAMLLAKQRQQMEGDVVFFIQPAEEITRGAAAMLDHGLLDKLPAPVSALFGLHCEPRIPTGKVISKAGYASAGKTNFRVTLQGTTGHSGSPHTYHDVIVAGAALINGIQTIVSRNKDPLRELVCAVHTVHAGDPEFFVTDKMQMTGTIRAFDEEVSRRAQMRLREIAEATAKAYECSCHVEIIPEVPPQINHPDVLPAARQACILVFGPENILREGPAFMGAEDFAVFGKKIPSHFYWLGTGFKDRVNATHHHPCFRVDYDAIPFGIALLVHSALQAMTLFA
ncbi:MAG TPA: M20 family metallopeptidase [Clostridia bacterium]|nr:M20 family metallopeptidase [Clostridia bacterium]